MTTSPNWSSAVWLFVAATAIHNLEEAVWLPSWRGVRRLPWTRPRVDSFVFGFAAGSLSLLFVLFGTLAIEGGSHSPWAYLICGCALAMAINAFIPHLVVSLWTQSYAPGAGTAMLLVLPSSISLIDLSIRENYIDVPTFAVTAPLTLSALLISIPLLFFIGRIMQNRLG